MKPSALILTAEPQSPQRAPREKDATAFITFIPCDLGVLSASAVGLFFLTTRGSALGHFRRHEG